MSEELPAYLEEFDSACVDCEMSLDELNEILGVTICYDRLTKAITFIQGLLNYTAEDQVNSGCSGKSSVGKTYVVQEVLKHFPHDDIIPYTYASPKVFYHKKGVLCRAEDRSPLETKNEYVDHGMKDWIAQNPKPDRGGGLKEWRLKNKYEARRLIDEWNAIDKVQVVDLHQKFIVFLDQPGDEVLKSLRPLMSKDRKTFFIETVDRSATGSNRVKGVLLIGYPTIIFLSTSFNQNEQEQTRLIMLSPEVSQEKIKSSITLLGQKSMDRNAFRQWLNADKGRMRLVERVRRIAEAKDHDQVIISEEDMEYIRDRFFDEHDNMVPRHMRDFNVLVSLIKGFTLLNYFTREHYSGNVYANHPDVKSGYGLYSLIAPSNELGISPEIHKLYTKRLKTALDAGGSFTRRQVGREYFTLFKVRAGKKRIISIIEIMEEVGLVVEVPDPTDSRRKVIVSPTSTEQEQQHLEVK